MDSFISPALRGLLDRRIPVPDRQPIIERIATLAKRDILSEFDAAQRSSGTSFNPALCRVVTILIESANTDSAAKLLPLLDEIATGTPTCSPLTSAALTLDQLRHLHQSSAAPAEKKATVTAAQELVQSWTPPPDAQALHTQLSAWLTRYGDRY